MYHKLINTQKNGDGDHEKKKVGVQSFAGILSNQLINYAKKIGNEEKFMPEDSEQSTALGIIETQEQEELSSPTFTMNTNLGFEKNHKHTNNNNTNRCGEGSP
jgi:hypothetical protein